MKHEFRQGGRQQGKTEFLRQAAKSWGEKAKPGDALLIVSADPKNNILIERNADQIEGGKTQIEGRAG